MYERMLDKSVRPDLDQLIEWCGTKGTLFSDLIQFMTGAKCAQSEIRFPYGNSYGWCVTFRRKKNCFAMCSPSAMLLMSCLDYLMIPFRKRIHFLCNLRRNK